MRGLLTALGAVALLVLVGTAVVVWMRRPPAPPALDPGDIEARRVGTEMARLLEAGLVDPVLRQSASWEERAESLVRRWYGSDRPGGGTSP